ncbi:hypothetical protein FAZ19_07335 [Sphingobacterium alkalisoli]|uniref:Uncharacterized protein n=1 Tax=Sphingobacterium alkalisoli TaxID=1874115 RepID=A0A4U0H645_9SPHI|nr:hypothetical protein [Sphingobacterium alkalisoli]TJY66724.1 hypothetical protein FAZ19_07335 [Sphingobacterium alkalisoli]GGH14600.1 hypothetical protein GCM10011418_15640 [Sphingobacterium alkalisoli]
MNERVCIYAKDISVLLGKSYKQSVRILRTMKDAYGKDAQQYLTLEEFSEYTGIDMEIIRRKCLRR